MKRLYYIILLCLFNCNRVLSSTDIEIKRIDPPNWWVGMKDSTLQLCIYGKNISSANVTVNYSGIRILNQAKVANPDYLFVDLVISATARAGNLPLMFTSASGEKQYSYPLMERDTTKNRFQGFDSRDFIYMLIPDRFSNGDVTNDVVKGFRDSVINRDSIFYRHGGDLQGVINHLDYIKDLGATAIWMTPVLENDERKTSYHGYAITDHYKVDPRIGDNDLYKQLVQRAHEKGLKVIMDMVYNHTGLEHWFIKDLPSPDWIHQFDTFFQTNYRATALVDPYASEYDRHKMSDGWFVKSMPDLNQRNPYLARYLIQNSIWWIETTGIDGFRFDTYTYSDLGFMRNLMAAVKAEYPKFGAVAELWDHVVALQAYFMQHSKIVGAPETNLPGLIDFQLNFALDDALNKPMDWTEGLTEIYYVLAQDFLYDDPDRNLTFLDNHDLSRFYSVVGEDFRKFKMGVGFLLTMRGIPCLYYGTELLMKNFAKPDGKVRADFPGGWPGDKQNKFTEAGRTTLENEAYNYIRKLALFRQGHPVLQTGSLTQFVPENDTYVYFRTNESSAIMVVMHYGEKTQQLPLGRFNEKLIGYLKGTEVMTGKAIDLAKPLNLEPFSIQIIELSK